MNATRAIKIALRTYPTVKFTGNGYEYDGDYYLELAPKTYDASKDGLLNDAYFKVDGTTASVTKYNPVIDGFHDFNRINRI